MNRRSNLPLLVALMLAAGILVGVWQRRPASGDEPSATAQENGETIFPAAPPARDAAAGSNIPWQASVSGEMKGLAERMSRETEGLKVIEHADGRRSVSLKGRFLPMSAMVRGEDGKPEIRCFTNFDEMAAELPDGRNVNPPQPLIHVR